MSLTSAMQVAFTGIDGNSTAIDTVGNNLANVNTTAFKGQRTLFETLLFRTLSEGEPPGVNRGGTLPHQIGTGTAVSSLQRNFAQGALESTAFPTDLALDGDGFFILDGGRGEMLFTRDGSFRLDAAQTLVAASGAPVQIFPADDAENINTELLSELVIPLGSVSPAVATSLVEMDGRLDSSMSVAAQGAVDVSQPLATAAGVPATESTALTDLVNEDGARLFAVGDQLAINAAKGGISYPPAAFVVGSTGLTVADLAGFLEEVLGINPDPATGGTPGVTISDGSSFPAGALVIESNRGRINAVELNAGSIVNQTGAVASPFVFSNTVEAVGDGVTTSFNVFDSLGNPVDIRLRTVLESKSDAGSTWRFFAESVDDSDVSPVIGTGTIAFDATGRFVSATGTELIINRSGTGAASPMRIRADFSDLVALASADGTSQLAMATQNGAPPGILTGFSIDRDGVVTAAFSNQQTQVLGQVALARLVNNEGLVARAENVFVSGPNSGDPRILAPQTDGTGAVVAGALEQSNVEIAREFINLISASTAISSSSRVIRVADDLLRELLFIAR